MIFALWIVLAVWAGMALVMAAAYALRNTIGHTGMVDAVWALGVGTAALVYALFLDGHWLARSALVFFAGIWSLRLGLHILTDRIIGKPEDGRYLELIATWGEDAPRRLFRFFQFQAFFVVVFSLPFIPLALSPSSPSFARLLPALGLWCLAIGGEAIADAQLARWRGNPDNRGRTCRVGLWGYSRHPNYFFEWLHWWVYVVLGFTAPWGWITLLGPILMFFFLYRVTGIPYTEKQALKSRGDDYRDYQANVSAFFPWFSKKK